MPKIPMRGSCQRQIHVKVWKSGHSIKCCHEENPRPRTEVRYWQPDPDIESEVKQFCKECVKK